MCRLLLVLLVVLSLLLYPAPVLAQDPPSEPPAEEPSPPEEEDLDPYYSKLAELYKEETGQDVDPAMVKSFFEGFIKARREERRRRDEAARWQAQYALSRVREPGREESRPDATAAGGWPTVSQPNYSIGYRDGWYHINVNRENYNAWSIPPGRPPLSDTLAVVVAQPVGGSDKNLYGLYARRTADGRSGYFAGVTGEGKAYVGKHVGGQWQRLGSEESSAIATGGRPNILALAARGNTFVFWVNFQEVARFTDDSCASGVLGLFAGTLVGGNQTEVRFNHLEVWGW